MIRRMTNSRKTLRLSSERYSSTNVTVNVSRLTLTLTCPFRSSRGAPGPLRVRAMVRSAFTRKVHQNRPHLRSWCTRTGQNLGERPIPSAHALDPSVATFDPPCTRNVLASPRWRYPSTRGEVQAPQHTDSTRDALERGSGRQRCPIRHVHGSAPF